jgi:hypothetical protein
LGGGFERRKAAISTQDITNRINTVMPGVVLELTTPVFERAKVVHALTRAVTVISQLSDYSYKSRIQSVFKPKLIAAQAVYNDNT